MIFLLWAAYLIFLSYIQHSHSLKSHTAIFITLSSSKLYLNLFLPLIVTIVIDLAIHCYLVNFSEIIVGAFLVNFKEKGKLNKLEDLSERSKMFYDKYFSEEDAKEYLKAESIAVNRLRSKDKQNRDSN